MRALASGNFLAFVANGFGGRSGSRVLAHVMVPLGDGEAAGTNNRCIGAAPNWSIADRDIETSKQPSCIVM